MSDQTITRARLFVTGRVQGVNFRWHTQRRATELGLTGIVRNLPDGRVEAIFEGPAEAVRKAIQWCRVGPSSARVDNVEIHDEEPTGEFRDFRTTW
jgi:acylphosphatase